MAISNIDPAWTFPTNQNISATVFNNGISRVIGYTGVTYLDITNVDNVNQQKILANVTFLFKKKYTYSIYSFIALECSTSNKCAFRLFNFPNQYF